MTSETETVHGVCNKCGYVGKMKRVGGSLLHNRRDTDRVCEYSGTELKGYGSLKDEFEFREDIDLTKPIYGQSIASGSTDHEAKAREILQKLRDIGVDVPVRLADGPLAIISVALRDAEAPLLKRIVELSSKVQRVEEINENLRAAVRDHPIKWNDEYYEMRLKEARLQEREECAKIADELNAIAVDLANSYSHLPRDKYPGPPNQLVERLVGLATAIRNRS